ncbi:MAG: beta-ketoacyl-[acyl-carrier-protein] synthase II [bacterium (Candidatus Stahlbacteria) CG08_land_8_20_14_0_20_40_26]|nr:MAG: beta-ketoacyl-[acyl-carrier-protein] synthase II [bacterium (Candidatus Stahlbacteria) CG23_combo_of_CG06-09_8_20_14_all_40_9]PIS24809.1 MAG: beta-ketoacyl-[acyl-carrier-protein] synthase II [bacterium (Candidatus Stahlbacteria) CG08_land_8_20_14_0_20_40_26]
MRRVVITGMGAVTPIGLSKEEFWRSLLEGKSGVSHITRFDTSGFSVRIAAELKNFSPEKFFPPKKVRRLDRYTQFAICASREAVEDSEIDLSKEDTEKIGVIIGSGIGGIETWEEQHRKLLNDSPRFVSPFFVPMMIINSASAEIGIEFGLKGPNFCVASACASSGHAIGEAYRIIKDRRADVMLTGGTEAAITPTAVAGFANMKAISPRNDEPEKASRPFDKERDGFVLGEGAGILVLEEYEHAITRGKKPYCEVAGFGMTCDAYHITAPDPNGREAARVIKLALGEARLETVDYINAHGTSTPLNDKIETMAVKLALGEKNARKVAISSTKSMIGHLLGAAGACELIACVLSMRDGIAHPTINLENPDPECDLDYVPNKARKIKIESSLSNSFGFGGHNSCIALKTIS